jgi:hypothetical protein
MSFFCETSKSCNVVCYTLHDLKKDPEELSCESIKTLHFSVRTLCYVSVKEVCLRNRQS